MLILGDSIYSTIYRPSTYSGLIQRQIALTVGNGAIPGHTISTRTDNTGIANDFVPQIHLTKPAIVEINGGTNDLILGGISRQTIQDAWSFICSQAAARGIKLVICPILPAVGRWDDAHEQVRLGVNAQLAAYAADNPSLAAIVDISGFDPRTMTVDIGLHPNEAGSFLLAKARHTALLKLMSDGDILSRTAEDPLNYLPIGFMVGTAGAKKNGATGSIATGWSLDAYSSGAGPTVAASKVARSDSFGDWQQIEVSGTSPSDGSAYSISLTCTSIARSAIPVGSNVEIVYEFEVDAGAIGFYGHAATGSIISSDKSARTTVGATVKTANNSADLKVAYSGVFRTVGKMISNAGGIIQLGVQLSFKSMGAGRPIAATVRIGRVGLRMVA